MDGEDLRRSNILAIVLAVDPHLLDHLLLNLRLTYGFHQSQMLEIVMSLEESVTREELDEDAANAPDVTGEAPAEIEYDFGSTIVASGDDG